MSETSFVQTLLAAGVKSTHLYLTIDGKTICFKCDKEIKGSHWKGIWVLGQQFEENGDRVYIYALCKRCLKKSVGKKTGKVKEKWAIWFEEEIIARLSMGKHPRLKLHYDPADPAENQKKTGDDKNEV